MTRWWLVGTLLVALTVAWAGMPVGAADVSARPQPVVVSHVSSVTHVAAAGSFPVTISGAASVNQSGSWTVQAAHQGGQWNVAHVSSRLHVMAIETPVTTNATLTNVSASGSNVTLAASNAARVGLLIFHHASATSNLFVKFGATASTSSFTVVVPANTLYELPRPVYTGIVDGIWTDALTGTARVTEITR